jgi:pyruvate dehydrogenase E1 component alpha subunit
MKTIRAFEAALSARRDHGFQLLSTGEEAVAAALSSALRPGDQLLTSGRSIGPALARGVKPGPMLAELLGKTGGPNKGKAGRGHISDPAVGFFGAHAVVGGNISIAAGVALAALQRGDGAMVAVLFGDGACGAGVLHETLNIAAAWRLPLLFVCNNNRLSVSTPRATALAPARLSDLGRTFGMPAAEVDGQDVVAATATLTWACDKVRVGGGPVFVECESLRLAAHSTTARETRSREELAQLRLRCPIAIETTRLQALGMLDEATATALDRDVARAVEEAVAYADMSPYPDPAEALTDVR